MRQSLVETITSSQLILQRQDVRLLLAHACQRLRRYSWNTLTKVIREKEEIIKSTLPSRVMSPIRVVTSLRNEIDML